MRPIHLTALAGALLLSFAPAVQAVEYTFGTFVASSDYDFSPMAETQRVALCFIDFNGDGVTTNGEPILLMTRVATNGVCPATLSTPSILLNNLDGRPAGVEINSADKWGVKAVLSLSATHFVRYTEDGTDASKLDSKDIVYIDLKNTGASMVDAGDLRLTSSGTLKGGEQVKNGDADLARPLANIRGTARTVQSAGIVYKAGSGFYINADAGAIGGTVDGTCATTACPVTGDFGVESGDIRLNPKAVNPLSDKPAITVQGLSLSSLVVQPGELFQLSITVKNDGKAPGSGLVKTTFAGVTDTRGSPTVYPTETATLVVSFTAPPEEGRYAVKAGDNTIFLDVEGEPVAGGVAHASSADLEARIAALEAALAAAGDDEDLSPASASTTDVPGVAPSLVVLVLLAAVALARRKA